MTKPLQSSADQLVGKVVYREHSYRMIINYFYVIVGETPRTVLLKPIESIKTSANGQVGTEVPAPFNETFLKVEDPKALIRAKKHEPNDLTKRPWFSRKDKAYFLWDGQPRYFDYMD